MRFKAVIWDMDGLLLDTERLSHESWLQACQSLRIEIDEVEFRKIIGMNEPSFRKALHQAIGDRVDVPELVARSDEIYHQKIDRGVPLRKGARVCIEWLSNEGIPQSVATSSRQSLAQKKLGHHDLVCHFHSIVSGDQVTNGKPHPEIFITAAEQMGMEPQDCLAFEDSLHGVHAAAASGARVILVPDLAIHNDQSRGLADEIWESLEQGPEKFQEWLG